MIFNEYIIFALFWYLIPKFNSHILYNNVNYISKCVFNTLKKYSDSFIKNFFINQIFVINKILSSIIDAHDSNQDVSIVIPTTIDSSLQSCNDNIEFNMNLFNINSENISEKCNDNNINNNEKSDENIIKKVIRIKRKNRD